MRTQTEGYEGYRTYAVSELIRVWERKGYKVRTVIMVEAGYPDHKAGLRDWLVVYESDD